MKSIFGFAFLFAVLFTPLLAASQSLQINVTDSISGEALPFANIYFQHSGVGCSSNQDGLAAVPISKLHLPDTAIVSYIGYELKKVLISKSSGPSTVNIELSPSSEQIAEVVIEYEKPPRPKRLIREAIRNTDNNYSEKETMLRSLYRETLKENGKFIQLNEAITETHYSPYPQSNLDRHIWKDWYYDESYAFELEGDRYFDPLLNDFNTKADQQEILAIRKTEDWSDFAIETTLIGDPLILFALDKIKYQYDFFYPRNLSKYEFSYVGLKVVNGETCHVISFFPQKTNKKFSIIRSRKNKSAIYIGRLYLSKESLALVSFKYKLAVDRDFGFFSRSMPLDYQVEVDYKKRAEKWFLDHIQLTETRKVDTKENGEAILHTAIRELFVLDISTDNVQSIPDSSVFKSTRFSSIRHHQDNYNPYYWNDLELPIEAKLNRAVVSDLTEEKSLSAQYDKFKKVEKEDLAVPQPLKIPHKFNYHQTTLVDSLHWMALPQYKTEMKAHLAAENDYAKNELIEDQKYQRILFDELNNLYLKDDSATSSTSPGDYFFAEDSLNNEVIFLKVDSISKAEVFNITDFQSRYEDIYLKRIVPNPSEDLVAVQFGKSGVTGDFACTLPFGEATHLDSISNVYKLAWLSDSSLVYSKTDSIGRAGELVLRSIKNSSEEVIYNEPDRTFDIEVERQNDRVFCTVQSKTENEIYLIESDPEAPKLKLIKTRQPGTVNTLKTGSVNCILVNSEEEGDYLEFLNEDFSIDPNRSISADKKTHLTDYTFAGKKIVAVAYEKAQPKLQWFDSDKSKWKDLDLNLGIGQFYLQQNSTDDELKFSFSLPATPMTQYSYNFATEELTKGSQSEVRNSRMLEFVTVKTVWAKSSDDKKIPMTIMSNRAAKSQHKGLILKTYGAYGALPTPMFDARESVLLQEGYTIAYAHVRGEAILGRSWYKSGRLLQKKNSIQDYLACAEYLIDKGFTTSGSLVGYGNSAGGLVVAQAVNENPSLFNTVILDHPFVDVINTMMNDTLPLTIDEYKEWGNPQQKEVYDYMTDYSPYQNIQPQDYPNVLLIGSYLDYQTPVWQIAKYASKLRENNTGDSEILLMTDMSSGHMGSTTGKEWIKLFAQTYSFVHLNLDY